MTTWTELPESGLTPATIAPEPGVSTGEVARTYQRNAALNGDLGADLANRTRYVAPDGSNTNSGRKPWSAHRHIAAALDSLPDDNLGICIKGVPGVYEGFEWDGGGLLLEGLSGVGQDTQTGLAGMQITGGSGELVRICKDTGGEYFQSNILRNLAIVGQGTADVGLVMGRTSNFLLDGVRVSDIDGQCFQIKGSDSSQYGVMRNCSGMDSPVGVYVFNHNGLRIDGCTFEYLDDAGLIHAGTTGIFGEAGADTLQVVNCIVQFFDDGVVFLGEKSVIGHTRMEALNTGIRLKGSGQQVAPGCSFNDFIIGGEGTPVVIHNTAQECVVYPIALGSHTPDAVRDSGTNTDRRDSHKVNVTVPAVTTGDQQIHLAAIGSGLGTGTYFVRDFEIKVGANVAAGGSDRTFQLYAGNAGGNTGVGPGFNTSGGWTANAVNTVDMSASNNNPVSRGDTLFLDVGHSGTAPALTNLTVSFLLAPY